MTSNCSHSDELLVIDIVQCEKQISDQENLKTFRVGTPMLISNDNISKGENASDGQCLHEFQANFSPTAASQKKFFFVDRSGGKNTIYLHPSIFEDLSPGSLCKEIADLHSIFEQMIPPDSLLTTDLVFLNEDQWDGPTEQGMAFKRVVNSAVAALNEMLSSRTRLFLDETGSNVHSFLAVPNAEAECKATDIWNMNYSGSSEISYSSMVDDSDDLEALLDSDDEAIGDDEATSAKALVSSDDEMSTGQSVAYDMWPAECKSSEKREYKSYKEKFFQKNNCIFEETDAESTVLFVAEYSVMPSSTCKRVIVSNTLPVPGIAITNFPGFPKKVSSPISSLQSDSGLDTCLSTGVTDSSILKREHSVLETCVHSGSAKKPRSYLPMQELQLIEGVVVGTAEYSSDAVVIDETISDDTSI